MAASLAAPVSVLGVHCHIQIFPWSDHLQLLLRNATSSQRHYRVTTFAVASPPRGRPRWGRLKELLDHLERQALQADSSTYSYLLRLCDSANSLPEGKRIHAHIIRSGFGRDVFLGNQLVNMYGKCGSMEDAQRTFDKMPERDVVTWSTMIGVYAKNGHCQEAFQLFQQMQLDGVIPNKVTFLNILNACTMSTALANGKLIHALLVESGLELDVVLGTAIVKMYSKCGNLEDARRMFIKMLRPNVVSWTTMIAAYAEHSHCDEALRLFQQMQLEGILPNEVTFLAVLDACASPAALAQGKVIHALIIESGFESHVVVGNAVIHMYGKCGSLDDAHRTFHNMPEQDVVSWNVMIAVFVQHGHGKEALQFFHQMQLKNLMPSKITFISVLDACADMAALEEGKLIHLQIVDVGFECDLIVCNAIVNMYGKCGSLNDARRTFDKMPERDVVSWNAMIAAYAQHGHGKEALELFQHMQLEVVRPNEVTFVSILCACSHAGLVDEGYQYFASMSSKHGIAPTMKHYGCMIDLLGRAGRLDEAEDFLNKMPFRPNAVSWTTLLGACRMHGEVERGKHAAEHILELDPQHDGAYVLLSNICAAAGRWTEVEKVRKPTEDMGVMKKQGVR